MLSDRDLCKATSRDGNGEPATIGHGGLRDRRQPGDFRTRSDKRDGDSSPMAAAEAPELRDRGDRGSGDLSRAAPIPGCAQISGGPARNRVVFIIGRRLKEVVYPSRETATGSAKHKARSAMSGSQARTPSFAHSPPKLMKTAQILAGLPLENASPQSRCYLSCSNRCRRKGKPPPRRSCKGSSEQLVVATGALEKDDAVI